MSILQTQIYKDLKTHLDQVRIIDTHEHLQRDSEIPTGEAVTFARLFMHYTNSDLISAGGAEADITAATGMVVGSAAAPALSDEQRWRILKPWYQKAWNTGYCEAIRLSIQKLWGIEDVTDKTYAQLTERMRRDLKPGFTRKAFDVAGVDFAMNNPFGPKLAWNGDFDADCHMVDLIDNFDANPVTIAEVARHAGITVYNLDDFLQAVDSYYDRYGKVASAFKCGRAYGRSLHFPEMLKSEVERVFLRALPFTDRPNVDEQRLLENYMMHHHCRRCAEQGLRMKFHTGYLAGNGGVLENTRALHLTNLFMKYRNVNFDLYHIAWPFSHEVVALAKIFPNVTVNFCWAWIVGPSFTRRVLSEMLDAVPANKIHGFGGDYRTVELVVGHAEIARREIARVLAEKVIEGRFTEDYAAAVGTMLLRDNAMENFDLPRRRKAFRAWQKKEKVAQRPSAGK